MLFLCKKKKCKCQTVLCTIRDVIECQISVQFYAHMKLNKTQESEEKTPSKVYVEKKKHK